MLEECHDSCYRKIQYKLNYNCTTCIIYVYTLLVCTQTHKHIQAHVYMYMDRERD